MKKTFIECAVCGEIIGESQTWEYENGKDDGSDELYEGAQCADCGEYFCEYCGEFEDGLCAGCRPAEEIELDTAV